MKTAIIFYSLLFITTLHTLGQTKKDRDLLKQMTDSIEDHHFPGIHSVLIFKGDQLIYSHYFNGFSVDSLHDSRSSFKSITSLLIGIAIDKGFIKDVNQKVYSYFPEYVFSKTDDPRKKEMTIQNLLNMESGYDCEEFNESKVCEDDMEKSKDWVRFSLTLPLKDKPGTVWAYTSCDPMILSGIIKKATHLSVMDFSKKYLFQPLGITNYRWTVDPSGNGMTAGSFYILPSDMLKIGKLVRDQGKWKGKQVISSSWIDKSTAAPIPIPDFSFVKSSRSKIAIPQQTYYGDYWYREQIKTPDLTEEVHFASGNGGQYIFIIKRLNLVIVFTQGNYNSRKAKQAFDLLARYILPKFEQK